MGFIQLALYAFISFLFCFFLVVNSIVHLLRRPSSAKPGLVIMRHPITNLLNTIQDVIQDTSQFSIFICSSIHPPSSPTYHAPPLSSTSIGNLYLLSSHLQQSPSLMTPDPTSDLRQGRRIFSRFRGCRLGRRTPSQPNQDQTRRYRTPHYLRVAMLRRPNIRYLFEYRISPGVIHDIALSSRVFGEKSIPATFELMLTMQFKITIPFAPTIFPSRSNPLAGPWN
jgi:hypothetical protein